MNILICDDRQEEAAELDSLLHASDFTINTILFHNGYDALDYIRCGAAIDVCFLDIVMPEINGTDLAKGLWADGFTGEIVFISSSREYGPEVVEASAFAYLLKPLTPENVEAVLCKLEYARKSADSKSILVKTVGVVRAILYREISYVEVIGHNVYFHLTSGNNIEIYSAFKGIAQKLLLDPRFIQCHRSYVVNMQYIAAVSDTEIIMQSGTRISVSRNYRSIKNTFYKWRFAALKNE